MTYKQGPPEKKKQISNVPNPSQKNAGPDRVFLNTGGDSNKLIDLSTLPAVANSKTEKITPQTTPRGALPHADTEPMSPKQFLIGATIITAVSSIIGAIAAPALGIPPVSGAIVGALIPWVLRGMNSPEYMDPDIY